MRSVGYRISNEDITSHAAAVGVEYSTYTRRHTHTIYMKFRYTRRGVEQPHRRNQYLFRSYIVYRYYKYICEWAGVLRNCTI